MFLNVAQRPFFTSNNIICEDCGNMNISMLFLNIQYLGEKVEPYPIINRAISLFLKHRMMTYGRFCVYTKAPYSRGVTKLTLNVS